MILDTQSLFSGTIAADGVRTGQAITATAISVNQIDMRNSTLPALVDEGVSGELWLVVVATTAAIGGDAAKTLTITLESDIAATLASAPVVHVASKAITGAQITAGATLMRVQLPSDDYKRFLGLRFTASVAFTAFNVFAFLTPDVQRNVIYPVGFTVDI